MLRGLGRLLDDEAISGFGSGLIGSPRIGGFRDVVPLLGVERSSATWWNAGVQNPRSEIIVRFDVLCGHSGRASCGVSCARGPRRR